MNKSSDNPNYLQYLKVIYRHRYIFLVVAMLVTTLVAVYAYRLPKKYQADSVVFIEKNVISNLVKGLAVSPDMRDHIRVLHYALSSRELISRVLTEMDSEIFIKSKSEQQSFIEGLKKRTGINVRGQELFTVSLIDKDPAFAQTYVNTLVGKYVEENTSSKRKETYGANRFLSEQIGLFKNKLDAAEDVIIEFREKNGIYFSLDEKTVLEEIKKFTMDIEDLSLTLDTLEYRRKALRKQLKSLSPTTETVEMFSSFDQFGNSEIAAKEAQLKHLLIRYTENHPEIVILKADIEELEKRAAEEEALLASTGGEIAEGSLIGSGADNMEPSSMSSMPNLVYQQVEQAMLATGAEIETLKAKKRSLQNLINKRQKSLREIPENRKELGVLVQERDSAKQIYQELLKRMSRSEVSKQMEISDKSATFRIVDPALFPEVPVSPNMLRMLLLAIVAGLGCGFGVVFLLDLLDSSIKSPYQMEALGIKILALIPSIDDGVSEDRAHKKDILFYSLGGFYYTIFIVLLICETMHFSIIDHLKNLIS